MNFGRGRILLGVGVLAVSACSASVESGADIGSDIRPVTTLAIPDTASTVESSATPTSLLPTEIVSEPATPPPATSEAAPATTSTTTIPEPVIFDPQCVVTVADLDSLGLIAARFDDETVNVVALRAENNLSSADLTSGELLDVCVGNGIDDITGAQRTDPDQAVVAAAVQQNVEVQQLKLNNLFEGLGTPPLLVDGISGPVTRQRLCAARLALGLPTSTDDMAPGSAEEKWMLASETLAAPFTTSLLSDRWVLIDRTCQIMFVGQKETVAFVFPTSTGSEGFETRDQDRSKAFRFDPALDNGGWHDSTDFPVAADNPLNGNMYQPLYFDLGQAIHGANNVPTTPQSKGCARLRVEHQDALVAWMGLADAGGPVWSTNRIGVTVSVQGTYVPR